MFEVLLASLCVVTLAWWRCHRRDSTSRGGLGGGSDAGTGAGTAPPPLPSLRQAPGWKIGLAVALVATLGLLPGEESLYQKAKTGLAQSLRQAAWTHALAGEPQAKPWPWDQATPAVNSVVPRLGLSAAIHCDDAKTSEQISEPAPSRSGSTHAIRIWRPTMPGSPRTPMLLGSTGEEVFAEQDRRRPALGAGRAATGHYSIAQLLSSRIVNSQCHPPDDRSDPGERDRNRAEEALTATDYGRFGRFLDGDGAGCAAGGGGGVTTCVAAGSVAVGAACGCAAPASAAGAPGTGAAVPSCVGAPGTAPGCSGTPSVAVGGGSAIGFRSVSILSFSLARASRYSAPT